MNIVMSRFNGVVCRHWDLGCGRPGWHDNRCTRSGQLFPYRTGLVLSLLCTFFVVFMVVMAFLKYGNIKLGPMTRAGVQLPAPGLPCCLQPVWAPGLLFWGVAEPIYHFTCPPGWKAKRRKPQGRRL